MTSDDPATNDPHAQLSAKDREIAELKERLGALSAAARSLRQRYEQLRSKASEGGESEPDAELRERALTLASRLLRKARENSRLQEELAALRGEVAALGQRLSESEAARQAAAEEGARQAREQAEHAAAQAALLASKSEEDTKERRDRAAFVAESEALNALVADKDARLAGLGAELERGRLRHYELEVEHAALRQNSEQMVGELERSRAECGRLLLLRDELAARLADLQNGSKESELLRRIEVLSRERLGLEAALKETQGQLARERVVTERLAETEGREAAFAESLAKRDHALGALSRKLAMAIEEGAELAADCAAAREELADGQRLSDELARLHERLGRRIRLRPMPLSND